MKLIALKEKNFIHLKRHFLLYLLLIILVAVVIYRVQTPADSKFKIKPQAGLEVGMQAPGFTLRNLNGNLEGLSEFKDKVVILNFWATWCAPCREEMPHLDTLQSINKLENLKIFPINVGKEKIEKAEKFFLELKIKNLDIYFDDTVKLANSFSLRGIPTSVIINKNGEEFARIMGAIDFTDKKFVEWLRKYN